MKYYDPKNWLFGLLHIDKTDTIRLLKKPIMIMAFYATLIAVLEIEVFEVSKNSSLRNVSMIHTTLGFVLSLLLAFRTNTAYDRWWQGRTLWGQLTNISRNLAIKINAILLPSDTENRQFFQRHIILFPYLLSRHLSKRETSLALDKDFIDTEYFEKKNNHPMKLVAKMSFHCGELHRKGILSDMQMRQIDREISTYMDICGGCERIKNTPIPFSYSSFIKRFIIIYVFVLPVSYTMTIGYATVPLTIFVFYVLMSLELIAEEIEDPFNHDINDIPTEQISQNIQKNIEEILKIENYEGTTN